MTTSKAQTNDKFKCDEIRDSDTTMKDDMKLNGPYEINIEVHITDGETEGKITIGLSMGSPPTQRDIDEAMNQARTAAEEGGYRLMTKGEFFNAMMRERLGVTGKFACPDGDEWDAVPVV